MKAFFRHVRVEPLSIKKKDLPYRKNISAAAGKSEHLAECQTITQETVKKFFRGTGHSNNITAIILSLCLGEKGFRNSLKHAF